MSRDGLDYDYIFKLLIIGDSGVGKSSLMNRYVDNIFVESFINTIGVDFKIKTLEINKKIVKLQIWDTAGQERFRTIVSSYYRGANGIMLVYDITNKETFNSLDGWLNEISKYANERAQKILIGTKLDLIDSREISYTESKEYAEKHNMILFETSSKTSQNIDNAFIQLSELLIQENHIIIPNRSVKDTYLIKKKQQISWC
jgi:Ras-related protein Rab-1A